MYDFILIIHFVGVAIGAGTSVYMATIKKHTLTHQPDQLKPVMLGLGAAVSRVGAIGLLLLIISGIILMVMRGGGGTGWAFSAKMLVVLLIIAMVGALQVLQKRARLEEGPASMLIIKKIAPFGPVLALAAIIFAVLEFH